MSDSRAEIFSRLQRSRSDNNKRPAHKLCEEHIKTHKRGVLPAINQAVLDRFISKIKNVSVTYHCINNDAALPGAVLEYINEHNINPELVAAPTLLFEKLDWSNLNKIEFRNAQDNDLTTLTLAYAAVAETGTLVLCSGPESPTTLNFLPDNNICVVRQKDIYNYMEQVWDILRNESAGLQGNVMPRAINLITGPSRTADVEQTIQLGAHGPRHLHIIILTD